MKWHFAQLMNHYPLSTPAFPKPYPVPLLPYSYLGCQRIPTFTPTLSHVFAEVGVCNLIAKCRIIFYRIAIQIENLIENWSKGSVKLRVKVIHKRVSLSVRVYFVRELYPMFTNM